MIKEELDRFNELLDRAETYSRISAKLDYDMQCSISEEGVDEAAKEQAAMSGLVFDITHSDEYTGLLDSLYNDRQQLHGLQKRAVEYFMRARADEKNLTRDFAADLESARSKAYGSWIAAKRAKDFSIFAPALARMIELEHAAIDSRDKKYPSYYDACLDDYEPGSGIAADDVFFGKLKACALPLIKDNAAAAAREYPFAGAPCPADRQKRISARLMEAEGLRASALSFGETEHPFTDSYGPRDVRVTTHFYENMPLSNVYSTMHEGGHALFMMYMPQEIYDAHLGNSPTSAMHECISRFYENIIGRSEAFCQMLLPILSEECPDPWAGVKTEELYRAVNRPRPELIRMEADELTYCVHIMIRYELEKAFVNGDIGVKEIPALWNAKYKEYLGLDVPDDAQGALQDIHWTDSYGYFPSYAIGSAYGAQILHKMQGDFDVFGSVAAGRLTDVTDWMKVHVFPYGHLEPDDWIKQITGEPFTADHFTAYLENKYGV